MYQHARLTAITDHTQPLSGMLDGVMVMLPMLLMMVVVVMFAGVIKGIVDDWHALPVEQQTAYQVTACPFLFELSVCLLLAGLAMLMLLIHFNLQQQALF